MRAHLVVDRSACAMLADHHIARDQSVWALVMMMMVLMLIPKIHGLIPHPCQRYTIHTLPLLPPPSLPFVASSPFSYPPRHRLSPHYLLHLGHLGIVKGVADAQEAVGLLAGHAALLGQVRLAVEDVVGPALGGLVHELELVVEVGQGLGVVLLEPGQLLGGGLGLLGEGVELPELLARASPSSSRPRLASASLVSASVMAGPIFSMVARFSSCLSWRRRSFLPGKDQK